VGQGHGPHRPRRPTAQGPLLAPARTPGPAWRW
jgi:hypothetical protein